MGTTSAKREAWKAVSENDYIAVVDSELRVRGMEGLRVADASVMIGEKAADLVRGAGMREADGVQSA